MELSRNFTWREAGNPPERYQDNARRLADELEAIRTHVGGPIIVSSWYRAPGHNLKVGGSSSSAHLVALAADIRRPGLTADELYSRILDLGNRTLVHWDQLIGYRGHVHIGLRSRLDRYRQMAWRI